MGLPVLEPEEGVDALGGDVGGAGKGGGNSKARAIFYKALFLSVLLYGRKSWVITESMMKFLEGRVGAERWEWLPVEDALEAAGIWPMKEYIRRRQATIEEYISISRIYELCTRAEWLQGKSQMIQWWDQDHSRAEGDNNNGVE